MSLCLFSFYDDADGDDSWSTVALAVYAWDFNVRFAIYQHWILETSKFLEARPLREKPLSLEALKRMALLVPLKH